MKFAFFDCFYVMQPLKKGVHYSCFYKGHWERVKKCDINTLTFLLESGIELHWDCEKKDWKKQDF